jgi:hypothetical protein
MIKTGLIGNGYWGKIVQSKLRILSSLLFVQSSKSYDPSVFNKVDWIFVVTPEKTHFKIAKDCLKKKSNVFIEKPFCSSLEQALELISLSKKFKNKLYVNNLFLKRKETLLFEKKIYKKIHFKWHKPGPYNDNLFNDLLYHDLYILIDKLGAKNIQNISFIENNFNCLSVKFYYGNSEITVDYKRGSKFKKLKTIYVDDKEINFSATKDDPLLTVISDCFNDKIDFVKNHALNLKTIESLLLLKNHIN